MEHFVIEKSFIFHEKLRLKIDKHNKSRKYFCQRIENKKKRRKANILGKTNLIIQT
jgi:hypothetical protein